MKHETLRNSSGPNPATLNGSPRSAVSGLLSLALGLALTACQPPVMVQKNFREMDADVTYNAVGADQRVVITSNIGEFSRPGAVDPTYITCTEPSPDVAKALTQATNLALGIAERGSIGIANSQATAIAQLAERTGGVQLLRERMYQSCLAYKNGAISGVTYTLLMTRLDDAMITMLLGETAGGAFGRTGAAIGATSGGTASATVPALISQLGGFDEAIKEVETTTASLKTKQDELKTKQEACDREVAAENAKADAAARKSRDDLAVCGETDKLAAEVQTLTVRLSVLTEGLRGQLTSTASANSAISNITAMGGIETKPDAEIAAVIERMQDNFLSNDATANVIPACLVELGLETTAPPTSVVVYEQALGQLNYAQQRVDNLKEQAEGKPPNDPQARQATQELPEAQKRVDEAKKRLTDVTAALSTGKVDDSGNPYQEVFQGVLRAWDSLEPREKLQNMIEIAEAAAATRRSSLSAFCVAQLPRLVDQLGRNAQSLRKDRLEYDRDVRLERARAEGAANLARMYELLPAAVALCDKQPEAERAECRRRLLPGQQAALPATPANAGGVAPARAAQPAPPNPTGGQQPAPPQPTASTPNPAPPR